ncbi:probable G-protein coupled receptor Mth-like 2 [Nephila pilipes]|uniref:Probable G-protein coupled receptor Mth-like 2 n=1 Tax=Nephila pilipes TaxID=299642 RepID=A0A8X6NTU6_NEPPI|nr:probable G-protein coupled receptor Mth-like 2 [Nephila pilipes]
MQSVGNPLNTQHSGFEVNTSASSAADNLTQSKPLDCRVENIGLEDVEIISKNKMYIPAYDAVMQSSVPQLIVNNVKISFNRSDELKREIFRQCSKWMYGAHEFKIFPNGSALVYKDMMEPGTFELSKGKLLTCTIAINHNDLNSTADKAILLHHSPVIIMGKVGSAISILALTGHLLTFCLVPTLRNLPGYNLASLSLAFLLGYSFVLIGQIPEVLGVFCIVSGVLQANCLLTAFFCMNVMAFDVWRTLRLATTKLIICSHNKKRNHFIIYSIYSWGMPLIITSISVVIDNIEGVPYWIKPNYGRRDICWITNNIAKAIFFSIPAFTLILANGVFFVMTAFIIRNNTMKNVSDQHKQTVRLNFILYVRLGFMMGATWLIGIIAIISRNSILWIIFDLLNSLQGLFIFLLFTCSRKVFKHVRQKISIRSSKTPSFDNKSTQSNFDKLVRKLSSLIGMQDGT